MQIIFFKLINKSIKLSKSINSMKIIITTKIITIIIYTFKDYYFLIVVQTYTSCNVQAHLS